MSAHVNIQKKHFIEHFPTLVVMLGVAHAGVVGAVNNPDASQIIIRRQIAQFHWEPPA